MEEQAIKPRGFWWHGHWYAPNPPARCEVCDREGRDRRKGEWLHEGVPVCSADYREINGIPPLVLCGPTLGGRRK